MVTSKKSKDLFVLKQFSLGDSKTLIVAMEESGIIKIRYTETEVEITVWDSASENVLHTITCKHADLISVDK